MNIAVLCGGLSAERDVSLSTGAAAASALRRLGHRVAALDLFFGREGRAGSFSGLFTSSGAAGTPAEIPETAPDTASVRASRPGASRVGENVFEICREADMVFIALHGADGEDGKLQAAFDLLGIKYTGTGFLGSALAMDKSAAKRVFRERGIRTPRGFVARRGDEGEALKNAPFPCVVKPCCGGSSVGTSVVFSESELAPALGLALRFDERALIEEYIQGRECAVGVLAGRSLPVIEIRPGEGFYDYKNKYQKGAAAEICPAELPGGTAEELRRTAEDVFRALDLRVYGRMDFIVDGDGGIWCLEANTLPGLTPTSLLPQEAAAAGIGGAELIDIIVRESLKKYEGT
ncbi:MAG: D-alanine--D-alanine ligase [Oscillospiraceae bacterium]|jgi:D-alanine-D-alanine ligase|nr:D-alanine--D-alanine ligase [Oscillospiraceae bacterium]